MTDFNKFFNIDVKNTLGLKNGVNFNYKGPWVQVYENTELDRWYVGDFASANYHISIEFNSNKKETLSVLVVARPGYANYTVYGRVAIDDELVDISAVVNNNHLSLILNPKVAAYKGMRAIFTATYAGTLTALSIPATPTFLVPDTSPNSGSGTPGTGSSAIDLTSITTDVVPLDTGVKDLGKTGKRWRDLFISGNLNINGAIIGASNNAVDLPTGSTIGGSTLKSFSTVSVAGQNSITTSLVGDSFTIAAGTGISLTTDSINKVLTITNTGSGSSSGGTTVSASGFGIIAVSGQNNVLATRSTDSVQFIAGSGMTITTNPTNKTITFVSSGGSGGSGGTATQAIINEITTGEYPMVLAAGIDPLSGKALYANTNYKLNIDTGVLSVSSTSSRWADLAENYLADRDYAPGTVVEFGGQLEITQAGVVSKKIAGIISTRPAHLMNGELKGEYVKPVALAGRVPCKVTGKVKKGDMMVSAGGGKAKASSNPEIGSVIGKALEDFDGVDGTIEVVVGRI
jgi:hypothetical protein